jgi:ribosomal protein L11 methyltransferase
VLAIAALKMGAAEAVGTDTDAMAVQSARRNAELNALWDRFIAVHCAASLDAPEPLAAAGLPCPEATFDICIANILQVPTPQIHPLSTFLRVFRYILQQSVCILTGALAGAGTQIGSICEAKWCNSPFWNPGGPMCGSDGGISALLWTF